MKRDLEREVIFGAKDRIFEIELCQAGLGYYHFRSSPTLCESVGFGRASFQITLVTGTRPLCQLTRKQTSPPPRFHTVKLGY